jgi:hypothetical protein
MTTTAETAVTIRAGQRYQILDYAASLLEPSGRTPEVVLMTARPLLAWAGEATGSDDLSARMLAMSHAYCNDRRQPGRSSPRRTSGEFLTEARSYYGFITGSDS